MKFIRPSLKLITALLLTVSFFSCTKRSKIVIDDVKVKSPAEYVEVAQKYYNQRSYRNAINIYQRLIDKFKPEIDSYEKDIAWAHYEIGFCYLLMKKYDEAEKYFEIVYNDFSLLAPRTLAEQRLNEIAKKRARQKKKES